MKLEEILQAAAANRAVLGLTAGETRNRALRAMGDALARSKARVLACNAEEVLQERQNGTTGDVMMDRMTLTDARFDAMVQSLYDLAELPDPLGRTLWSTVRPNGLEIEKVSVPMGTIAIVYESRPNVTADAAALCMKSGNPCILRCGHSVRRTALAIVEAMQDGLEAEELPRTCINLVEEPGHEAVNRLMTANGLVDLLIPRGGAKLIESCVANSTVPCIHTGTGICHIYVDKAADTDMALDIVENAKASRPSVCNAAEVCLVHKDIAARFLPMLVERMGPDRMAAGLPPVALRLDAAARQFIDGAPAGPKDFDTEFLDYVLAVRVVPSLEEAVRHIAAHSTHHSESIITGDTMAAQAFTRMVDSAAVYVNASTRFTDGGEFGFGCEMGISTQKLHARGPMGLAELCSYKYVITGEGQIR